MSIWWKFVWIGCGGALGAIARFSTAMLALRWFGPRYPWGTVLANLTGCLLMGVVFALSSEKIALHSEQARIFVMVGFLGAFTTFSSFALDNVQLLRQQSLAAMLFNIGLQNIAGILFVLLGMWVVQALS